MSLYLVVEDFKGGLDRRRSQFTAKAGTLWNCTNAHITRGGEIEKRKAFDLFLKLPAGTFGLHSAINNLYTFGSASSIAGIPAGINYVQLVHPSGANMIGLIDSENFNGAIYAVAQFDDGAVYHYYGGARVASWDTVVSGSATNESVGAAMAQNINNDANFTSSNVGDVIRITARNNNVAFTAVPAASGPGTPTLTATTIQNAAAAIPETLATGSFDVTGGTNLPGVNKIISVTVNGSEVMGVAVNWATSNAATALQIANQISAFANTANPRYVASAAGSTVTISAVAGSGASPNGFVVAPSVSGNFTVGNINNFSGGVDLTPALPQITTLTIGGTFDIGNTYSVLLSITSPAYSQSYKILGEASGIAGIVKTFGAKVYADAGGTTYFCAIDDPTSWSLTQVNGSGFINMSNQDAGSETLTGLGVYQGKLAVFARRTVQMWSMDADPTKNINVQTLNNIGTYAPRSVLSFGDLNLFFLADVGIRSFIPRDASGNATVSDIGTNIDSLLQENIADITPAQAALAVGIMEPNDGRYWLAVGPFVYVYSYFPSANISAWSIYDPGFSISYMVYCNGIIYVRAGDNIYAFGGVNGNIYDSCKVTAELPYLEGGKPGNMKTFRAVDGAVDGLWNVYAGADPKNPTARDFVGQINGISYNELSDIGAQSGTHLGLLLTHEAPGYARIGNLAVYYDDNGPRTQ